MNLNQWTPETCCRDESLLAEKLKCPEFVKSIPSLNHLNLDQISDGHLVRFRGMVQDMLDPEIYLEEYEVQTTDGKSRLQNGKFRDTLVLSEDEEFMPDSTQNKHGERRTMFIISIPGLNDWAVEHERKAIALNGQTPTDTGKGIKRNLEEGESMQTDDLAESSSENPSCKKLHTSAQPSAEKKSVLSPEYLLNSPIPQRPSKACMVKVYSDFDSFKLNQVFDVIGFLSVDPALDGALDEPDDFEDITEKQAKNPPPSLIPRLHAFRVNAVGNLNPLLDDPNHIAFNINEDVRKDLEIALTQCLFGDKLAANLLMCHLVSSVYVRNDLHCLGQFSLNLSQIPTCVLPEYTKELYEIIELLMPASHYLPMTLENMNTLQFVPKKDYQTNKLTSGLLQLAPHTHLILDETRLQPGKLESGVHAVASIAHMLNTQKLKYNFEFYQIEFDSDIGILLLSEGKSMLPSNCHVPLRPDPECIPLIAETIKATKHFLHQKLNAIRCFLTKMRIQQFDMDTEDSEMIQNDIVEIRRNINASVEDLHQLLVMSRLISLTFGKSKLDRDSWRLAKEFYQEIKNRHEQTKNVNRNEV